MPDFKLPAVTLCAAASVNVRATVEALRTCLNQVEFHACFLFTDAILPAVDDRITVVPISKLSTAEAYSRFLLTGLHPYIQTSHCLVVQWDGFITDPSRWNPSFLLYDYIGAPWPQFRDGHDVGNGGFSLRSRRLLEACLDPRFQREHPEDVAICRTNRSLLEEAHGIRFADRATASAFAFERTRAQPSFGFHGIFNMIPLLGKDLFWDRYCSLDDRSGVAFDYPLLLGQLRGRRGLFRQARLTLDALRLLLR